MRKFSSGRVAELVGRIWISAWP